MKEPITKTKKSPGFVSTRNACKLCAPLGASIAYRGVEGCVPLIHGSQGCATYIRRYLISHFREPMDIASTNFTEEATVFGGAMNLKEALTNISDQYKPALIGVCTTCLSETIGEDIPRMLRIIEQEADRPSDAPLLVSASTPSYQGTHAEGFRETVTSLVRHFARETTLASQKSSINLFPGIWSPADLRHLKEIVAAFDLDYTLLPDYSETLDNPIWQHYMRIPEGGTPLQDIRNMGNAKASLEFATMPPDKENSGSSWLQNMFGIPRHNLAMPIGIDLTDKFFNVLKEISGKETPRSFSLERGRLIDTYIDGHKYVFGKKAVVYGDEDMVFSITSFLKETGVKVILAATGNESKMLKKLFEESPDNQTKVMTNADFEEIRSFCHEDCPDMVIGNSKGYNLAREMNIPLIRVGFPVHDRIGAQRIQHIGYRGTQYLFDTIVNTLLQIKQDRSSVGYKYL